MSAVEHSRVARRMRPTINDSRLVAILMAAVRTLRSLSTRISQPLGEAADRLAARVRQVEPPLVFAEVAPAVHGSRLGRQLGRTWSGLTAAFDNSQLRRAAIGASLLTRGADAARTIGFVSWAVACAMAIHLFLLIFVEPYPYPSRSSTILPIALLFVAIVACAFRHSVAAAWRNCRS